MRRNQLRVGMSVAWRRGENRTAQEVIVVDLRPWRERQTLRSGGGRWIQADGGTGVAVALRSGHGENATWHPRVVQLMQLVGPYEEVRIAELEESARRTAHAQRLQRHREQVNTRLEAVHAALRDQGFEARDDWRGTPFVSGLSSFAAGSSSISITLELLEKIVGIVGEEGTNLAC